MIAGQSITKTLFFLLWIQLLHLTWAGQELGSLTPYGKTQKDTEIQMQNESSINSSFALHLDVPFKFTGKMYETIYLNQNGVITLGGGQPEDPKTTSWDNIPEPLPLSTAYPLIAAYWTNPQITEQGNLWFRQTMEVNELNNIKQKVERLYPQNKDLVAKWAFIATWENVSSQSDSQLTNTFQMVLVNIEDYSYLLFQYAYLSWYSWEIDSNETAESRIQAAVAGYNGADGISYTMLPGSASEDILKVQNDSNVDVPDLWIFRVDQSQEPCVQKNLATMLVLVILFTLLVGITLGLLIAWGYRKWKQKLNDYEDLDAETKKDLDAETKKDTESETPDTERKYSSVGQESTEEFTFVLDQGSALTLKPLKHEDIPYRKITVIKKN